MRRRLVWMLVALTAALLWAGGGASAGGSIESGMRDKLPSCDSPAAPPLEARTAASGSVDLDWSAGPAGTTRWEYRQRQEGGSWGAWATIPGSDKSTTGHSIGGLTEDARYQFQVRAITANGASLASTTASAVAGLTPPTYLTFQYNKYDARGGATAPGAFSLLTNAADLSSGITDYSEAPTATALLVNAVGASGRSYADRLNTLAVGDTLTWDIGLRCWFAYRVTALLADPPTPARKLFAIALTAQESCARSIYSDGWTSIVRGPLPNEPEIGADGIRIPRVDYPVNGGRTYRISDFGSPGLVVIDIPAGMRLIDRGVFDNGGYRTASFEDEASGAWLFLSFRTGRELGRYIPAEAEGDSGSETRDVGALFDAIVTSARVQPER